MRPGCWATTSPRPRSSPPIPPARPPTDQGRRWSPAGPPERSQTTRPAVGNIPGCPIRQRRCRCGGPSRCGCALRRRSGTRPKAWGPTTRTARAGACGTSPPPRRWCAGPGSPPASKPTSASRCPAPRSTSTGSSRRSSRGELIERLPRRAHKVWPAPAAGVVRSDRSPRDAVLGPESGPRPLAPALRSGGRGAADGAPRRTQPVALAGAPGPPDPPPRRHGPGAGRPGCVREHRRAAGVAAHGPVAPAPRRGQPSPCPRSPRRRPRRGWTEVPWEHTRPHPGPQARLRRAERLLALASAASLVQPGLLRGPAAPAARRRGRRRHRDRRDASPVGVLGLGPRPGPSRRIGGRGCGRPLGQCDLELRSQVLATIARWHAQLPKELLTAELLLWRAVLPGGAGGGRSRRRHGLPRAADGLAVGARTIQSGRRAGATSRASGSPCCLRPPSLRIRGGAHAWEELFEACHRDPDTLRLPEGSRWRIDQRVDRLCFEALHLAGSSPLGSQPGGGDRGGRGARDRTHWIRPTPATQPAPRRWPGPAPRPGPDRTAASALVHRPWPRRLRPVGVVPAR